jgi:ABC-2 type transport system permease protein
LILISDVLIGLPWPGIVLHAVVVAIIATGLSALNVGLGAYMPTFKENDPSKIVLGFGGTVNMVVGLGFLVAIIGLMAVPFHAAQLGRGPNGGVINPLVFAGTPLGFLLGILAVVLPLRAGARSLRSMEF